MQAMSSNFHYIFHENKKLLFAIDSTILITSRVIPNYLDPKGCEYKRSLIKRFFTITLLDNGPITLSFWLGRVKDITSICNLEGMCGLAFMVFVTSQMLEFARIIAAFAVNKLGDFLKLEDTKMMASMLGPRDFYAFLKRD